MILEVFAVLSIGNIGSPIDLHSELVMAIVSHSLINDVQHLKLIQLWLTVVNILCNTKVLFFINLLWFRTRIKCCSLLPLIYRNLLLVFSFIIFQADKCQQTLNDTSITTRISFTFLKFIDFQSRIYPQLTKIYLTR